MHEPFICPECGAQAKKAPRSGVCVWCEEEYRQGMAEVETERFERAVFGDEYADREAFLRDFNRGD